MIDSTIWILYWYSPYIIAVIIGMIIAALTTLVSLHSHRRPSRYVLRGGGR